MGYSKNWSKVYSSNQNIVRWPWSDVVGLSNRFCNSLFNKNSTILELGCGSGANIPFFASNQFIYHGLDGSPEIITMLHEMYPDFKDTLVSADFTSDLHFHDPFDLILDRAAITHNDTTSIEKTLLNIYDKLKPGGFFLAIDWFSLRHSDSSKGTWIDEHTRTDIPSGQFEGVGLVHFSDKPHLQHLFHKFKILLMQEKVISNYVPSPGSVFSSWNIVAIKD